MGLFTKTMNEEKPGLLGRSVKTDREQIIVRQTVSGRIRMTARLFSVFSIGIVIGLVLGFVQGVTKD